jgi:phosphoadenylyl-sulfate reductase (thioredoxin)
MTDADPVASAAAALEGQPPAVILRWAVEHAGPRVAFSTGFGVEGCALIDVIARAALPIDVITLDTGLLFPETYALWHQLEARYGIAIRAVQPLQSVGRQAAAHGPALWSRDPDRCCALRKVEPLQRALAGYGAWVTAIRRDQTAERASARVVERDAARGLVKVSPLAGWTLDEVWGYVYAHDVPYSELHARGYPSIGCEPCTTPVAAGEDPRAGRWRGSAKTECGLHLPIAGAEAAPPEAPDA